MIVNGKLVGPDTIKFAEPLPFAPDEAVTADIYPARNGSRQYPTPAEVLEVIRSLPPITDEDVADLLRAIDSDKRPPNDRGCFDDLADDE